MVNLEAVGFIYSEGTERTALMSEVQFTFPPVWAEYLKQAAGAQGTSFGSVVRSTSLPYIEAGKPTPAFNERDKRYDSGLPTDRVPWCNKQGVRSAVIWLSYLSTLTNDAHKVFASSLLAMVGLRLLPGEEAERETLW